MTIKEIQKLFKEDLLKGGVNVVFDGDKISYLEIVDKRAFIKSLISVSDDIEDPIETCIDLQQLDFSVKDGLPCIVTDLDGMEKELNEEIRLGLQSLFRVYELLVTKAEG